MFCLATGLGSRSRRLVCSILLHSAKKPSRCRHLDSKVASGRKVTGIEGDRRQLRLPAHARLPGVQRVLARDSIPCVAGPFQRAVRGTQASRASTIQLLDCVGEAPPHIRKQAGRLHGSRPSLAAPDRGCARRCLLGSAERPRERWCRERHPGQKRRSRMRLMVLMRFVYTINKERGFTVVQSANAA